MAKDQDEIPQPASVNVTIDRRHLFTGGAAAALATGISQVALGQGGEIHTDAGVYMNPIFLDTFNNKRYSDPAKIHKKIHDELYPNNRAGLQWGFYQQQLEPDPAQWGGVYNFNNWYIFRNEMREDLEKQRPFLKHPQNAMNPFDTSKVAANFIDHLDEAIRIALWDQPAVQVKIKVGTHKRRHHGLVTTWHPAPNWGTNPGLVLTSFTIDVGCPDGGWQGYGLWRNPTPTTKPITKLVSSWQVPTDPVNANGQQIIFIFNGLESVPSATAPGGILQPVLQWTSDGWYIRSWYVTSDFDPLNKQLPLPNLAVSQAAMTDGRCFSTAIKVKTGDMVTGTMTGGKDASGKFNYSCSITSGAHRLDLTVNDVPELLYAVCAIESYNVSNPAKDYPGYPNPITISSIDLQVDNTSLGSIAWEPNKKQGKDYETTISNMGKTIELEPK